MYNVDNQMSKYMFRTLDYIATHEVHVEYLMQLHQGTIKALAGGSRKYIERRGTRIQLTQHGQDARDSWRDKAPNWRSPTMQKSPVSDRVKQILGLAGLRVFQVLKKAS